MKLTVLVAGFLVDFKCAPAAAVADARRDHGAVVGFRSDRVELRHEVQAILEHCLLLRLGRPGRLQLVSELPRVVLQNRECRN
jgi:hypothetical protein